MFKNVFNLNLGSIYRTSKGEEGTKKNLAEILNTSGTRKSIQF